VLAERTLEDLISYLRAAMPHMQATTSTVTREMEMVRAFLAIAKVRLETSVLQIRGSDLKLDLPFSAMKTVAARDGSLLIGQAGGALILRLGAAATRWADKIPHPPSRLTKNPPSLPA
jgi:hypothetical protein